MKRMMALLALVGLGACQREPAQTSNEGASDVATTEIASPPSASASAADDRSLPAGRVSQYSSLGKDRCKLVEESEEGPYWRMRCDGPGGFSVDYTESDLRQNIAVLSRGGATTSLDLPSKVANGAFDRLGPTIEWRGPVGRAPDVMVVRVHVANDQGEDDNGRLAIARLTPKPCLVAVVAPQPGQSEKARAIADAPGPCLGK